jgi:hypothetical protein
MIPAIDEIWRIRIPGKDHQFADIRKLRHFEKIQRECASALLTKTPYPRFWPEAHLGRIISIARASRLLHQGRQDWPGYGGATPTNQAERSGE